MAKVQIGKWLAPGHSAIVCWALIISGASMLFPASVIAQNWGAPVWSQEFNGPQGLPDTTVWNFDLGNNNGWGNHEIEIYCGPPNYTGNPPQCPTQFSTTTSNAYIDGIGHLVIQAINNGGTWTSARMNTLTNPPTTFGPYGRIEASEKLPIGAGLWPAFWALGSNIQTAGWPSCGEMDFMENVPASAGQGPTIFSATMHGPGYSGGNGLSQKYTFPTGDVTSFHTYGAIWSPFMVQFYVDDPSNVFFIRTASDIPSGAQWVFNHPFILITNLAVGGTGSWPGPPDNNTPNPAIMLVDYVRYYQAAAVAAPNLGNPGIISIPSGASTASTTANLTAVSGSGRMYLNCSTTAPKMKCSVNTGYTLNSSVADFTSTNSATATVTVSASSSSMLPTLRFSPQSRFWRFRVFLTLLMGVLLLRAARARGRPRWANGMALAGLLLAGVLIVSCGGVGSSPPPVNNPPTPYSVTLNAYTVSGNGQAPDASVNIELLVYH
ncbi:MAG: glycoside hydrolase family 16 protein [Terriglobia bacterium]|jgi:beta-glucanase (GH16 family)